MNDTTVHDDDICNRCRHVYYGYDTFELATGFIELFELTVSTFITRLTPVTIEVCQKPVLQYGIILPVLHR